MLRRNPLQPPRPLAPASGTRDLVHRPASGFVSPEDFDCTGVLFGCDPCESRYWWMPELYGPDAAAAPAAAVTHAARQSAVRPTAAA